MTAPRLRNMSKLIHPWDIEIFISFHHLAPKAVINRTGKKYGIINAMSRDKCRIARTRQSVCKYHQSFIQCFSVSLRSFSSLYFSFFFSSSRSFFALMISGNGDIRLAGAIMFITGLL